MEIRVMGSPYSKDATVNIDINKNSESMVIELGLDHILFALDDILSDATWLKDEDFSKLLDVASEIQSINILRHAKCKNCDNPHEWYES